MCVIIVKNKGINLSDPVLDQCWNRNGQGAGYVFIPDKDDPIIEKGIMELQELKEKTKPFRNKSGILVTHLRIQSRGGISKELTHPFEFTKTPEEKRYLFHNGTVGILSHAHGQSDSSSLATLLGKVENEDSIKILTKLKDSRFGQFVTVIGRQIGIFGSDLSGYKDGLWFSNFAHENTKPNAFYGYGDDYEQSSHLNYTHQNYRVKELPPPRPTESEKCLSHLERSNIIKKISMLLAISNEVPVDQRDGYAAQIIFDHELNCFSDKDLLSLKYIDDLNPLLVFYKRKFLNI